MKKITFIIALASMAVCSTAHAEEKAFALFSDDKPSQNEMIATQYQTMETDPGAGGDPSPIDLYIPALLGVGMAMALYGVRKRKSIVE